jgi:hypothetical protein
MIRYSLVCAHAHQFEGWFRSSDDFDHQVASGLVSCPECGGTDVAKALMAPRVVTSESRAVVPVAPEGSEPTVPAVLPLAGLPPEARDMIDRLRALKAKLIEGSEDVGTRFAEEARRIHFGEAPKRAVHGEASLEEAQSLAEEGVDILALPVLPGERN